MVEVLLNKPRQDILKEGDSRKANPIAAAFERKMHEFYSSNAGKFVLLVKTEGVSQDDIFMKLRIVKKNQRRFIDPLIQNDIIEVKEHGNKFLVEEVHSEKVEKMIMDNLYDKELLVLIREHQGMDMKQICFYYNRTRPVMDKRVNDLRELELIKEVQPFVRQDKYYFSPDFILEGETGEETRKRMVEQIKVTRDEFEKERDSKLNFEKV